MHEQSVGPVRSSFFGVFCFVSFHSCFTLISLSLHCLRRIEGFRLQTEFALAPVGAPRNALKSSLTRCFRRIRVDAELWKTLRHPNVVALHEAFVTKEFDNTHCLRKLCYAPLRFDLISRPRTALCFVYDYHPGARTLAQLYLPTSASRQQIRFVALIILSRKQLSLTLRRHRVAR